MSLRVDYDDGRRLLFDFRLDKVDGWGISVSNVIPISHEDDCYYLF